MCVMSFLCFLVYSDVLLCLLYALFCYVQRLTLLWWYISQSFATCLTQKVMAARNEHKRLLTEVLKNLTQVIANQGGGGEAAAYHGLDLF